MSLEGAIASLDANIKKLITVMEGATVAVPAVEAVEEIVEKIAAVAAEVVEEKPAPKAKKKAAKKAEPETQSEAIIEYATVKKSLMRLASKDRDAAVAVLTSFDAKNGTELKEGDYAAAIAMFEKALADLEGAGDE